MKRSGIFTKAAVLSLAIYATVSLTGLCAKIEEAERTRSELQEKVNELTQVNASLEYDVAHSEDPETMEEIARDKLGLVRPGEKIFYDVSN